jgi:hypothetical protein
MRLKNHHSKGWTLNYVRVRLCGLASGHVIYTQWASYILEGELESKKWRQNGGNWRAIGRQFQFLVFVCAVNTKCAEFSYFDFDLKNDSMVLWSNNLFSDTVRSKISWGKWYTTFIVIGRQFPPSCLHFSHEPNDWSSRSRYIELTVYTPLIWKWALESAVAVHKWSQ